MKYRLMMQGEAYGQFTIKEIVNFLKISYKLYQNEPNVRPDDYNH